MLQQSCISHSEVSQHCKVYLKLINESTIFAPFGILEISLL